jgi:hypothetical protein
MSPSAKVTRRFLSFAVRRRVGPLEWIRLALGGFWVAAGMAKLIAPMSAALYLMYNYELHGKTAEKLIASLAVLEVVTGVALLSLGRMRWCSAWSSFALSVAFLVDWVIAEASGRVVRDCGCFGGLLALSGATRPIVIALCGMFSCIIIIRVRHSLPVQPITGEDPSHE